MKNHIVNAIRFFYIILQGHDSIDSYKIKKTKKSLNSLVGIDKKIGGIEFFLYKKEGI